MMSDLVPVVHGTCPQGAHKVALPLLPSQDAVYGYLQIANYDPSCKTNIDKFCELGQVLTAGA